MPFGIVRTGTVRYRTYLPSATVKNTSGVGQHPPSGCTVPSVSIYGVFLAPAPKADPRSDGVSVHRGRDGARPGVASAAALFLRALREGVHVKAQTSAPCAQRSFWVRPQLQFTYP